MSIQFKIASDVNQCEKLWRMFHPAIVDFWDLWEARSCFLAEMNNKLHFVVGYEGDEVIGVLPLCLNEERGYYTAIGNEFPEHNKLLLKDKKTAQAFFDHAPEKIAIECIDQKETAQFPFQESYRTYFLNLEQFATIDDYLQTFSPKHRKNLNYDVNQALKTGLKVKLQHDDPGGILLDAIAKFNIERFGGESSFVEKGYKESMRNLIELAVKMGILHMISIEHNQVPVAAEFAILFQDVYTVLMGGSDPKIKNLSKLLIYKHIEHSFDLKAGKLDFMAGADAWKQLWNFSSEMMYEYKKGFDSKI